MDNTKTSERLTKQVAGYRAKRDALLRAGRPCKGCAKTFFPKSLAPKFCSLECKRGSYRTVLASCKWCGNKFSCRPIDQNETCGPSCGQKLRVSRVARVAAVCLTCGGGFARMADRPDQAHCSKSCRERSRNKTRAAYLSHARRVRTRRIAANTPAGSGPVIPVRVFERDNWTCWICAGKVDRAAGKYDPLAPTLDHVIPVSRGGPHTNENVRCAHRRCNTAKNAKLVI